jgi:hypothetical protein
MDFLCQMWSFNELSTLGSAVIEWLS